MKTTMPNAPTQETLVATNQKARSTGYVPNVPLSKLVPFYGNDPDRTNRTLGDFQNLVTAFRAGAQRGPIKAVCDVIADTFYIINGHRTTEASRDAGFDAVDVFVTYPNTGETAEAVQQELFATDNLNRPYKGKAMFRTAILTNGEVLMSNSVKKAWDIVKKYVDNDTTMKFLADKGTPDLVKIADQVVTYAALARTKLDEPMPMREQKALFVTAASVLKTLEVQRETRDYVKNHLGRPTKILENSLSKGEVPAVILSDAQKNKIRAARRAKA